MSTLLATIVAFAMTLLVSIPAHAQASRTWVSGVGDDVNPCSRTAPCKTFAGAISKTAAGGEINCLDPGGFGAVTITKSIVIDCHEIYGSVLVSGTNGIIINGAGIIVALRNININGLKDTGVASVNGISILAAARVYVEDCLIENFAQSGINDTRTTGNTKLFVKNTTIRNNAGTGINLAAANANTVVIEAVYSVGNGTGLAAATGNFPVINKSVMSGNTTGVQANAGSVVLVDNSQVNENTTGVSNSGSLALANSDISFNTTAITGATSSFGNNRLFGNAALGTTPTFIGSPTTDHGQN